VKRALVSEKHAAAWLAWAKEHKDWTAEQWAKVIWSDESAIKKDSDARTVWIWRHKGNLKEKYLPKNVVGKQRDGDLSQMVWGCFMGNKIGPIVFVDESIKKEVYIGILEKILLDFIDALREDGADDIIFQQDNARPHTANATVEWLKTVGQKH